MWYRDLYASVELLSEFSEAQVASMEKWQVDAGAIKRRFQFEWKEFKTLHHVRLPFKVAERLDWLSQLLAKLPSEIDVNREYWAEIRSVARDVLPWMKAGRAP